MNEKPLKDAVLGAPYFHRHSLPETNQVLMVRIEEGSPHRSYRERGRVGIMKYCSQPSPYKRLTLQEEGLCQGKFWTVVPAAVRKFLPTPAPSSLLVSSREKQKQKQNRGNRDQGFKEVVWSAAAREGCRGQGESSTHVRTILDITL